MKQRVILHIDFDSFFASCEQQFQPQFRGKPLGVTAHNGRTVIIAASREAKKRGVKSPSRTFEALEKCPELLFTTSHFVKYWEISKKFINICKDYSPFIELFSLDEVFMDVTTTAHLFGGVYPLINCIRQRIKTEIGEYITVSVGISHNKLLAKLGSGLNKPNGLVEITPQNLNEVYTKAPLTEICGIGERISLRLNKIGIYNLLQLQKAPLPLLLSEFGDVEGHFLKNAGQGIDEQPIISYTDEPEVKSIGRNYCLPRNEYNQRIVLQNLYELSEEVAIKLRRLHKKAKTVGISLRGSFDVHGQRTDAYYFDNGREIFELSLSLIKEAPQALCFLANSGNDYIRQISVWISNLQEKSYTPIRMFGNEVKIEKIQYITDMINERFGDHTIRNAFLLYANKLTTEPNGFMADKYERTKLAQESVF